METTTNVVFVDSVVCYAFIYLRLLGSDTENALEIRKIQKFSNLPRTKRASTSQNSEVPMHVA